MEIVEKKTKSLALKTRTVVQESTDESSRDCSESENLNLLTSVATGVTTGTANEKTS